MKTINVNAEANKMLEVLNAKAKEQIKNGDLIGFNKTTNILFNRVDDFCMSLLLPKSVANSIIGELSRQYMECVK